MSVTSTLHGTSIFLCISKWSSCYILSLWHIISLKNLNTDPIQRDTDLFSLYCITSPIYCDLLLYKKYFAKHSRSHFFTFFHYFAWYLTNDWLFQVYWLVSVHTWLCRHPSLLLSRFTCTWIIVYPGNPVFLGSYHVPLIIQKFIHELSS